MSVVEDLRNDVLEAALTAQIHNDRQSRLTYSPGGPVDSIVEHALAAAKNATDEQRDHLRQIIRLAQDALGENGHERQCEHAIAGRTTHPLGNGWTSRKFVSAVTDPLATLLNPIITAERKQAAVETIAQVLIDVRTAGRDDLLAATNVSVRHALRVKKFTLLCELVARVQQEATS